jgi:site-specific DNA recombinase
MVIDNNCKNVIIYCRESRDDGFENYDRIETQRDILVAFCERQKLGNIIDIIMDDNKSGTSFERLEPIKEKIVREEVNIILCKDASRLGRNILESLLFTEFLSKYKVELIFESERYDEDMFPLIAWFNERRVKDDSLKIRHVLKHKMREGSIIIKAPYGYIKDGNSLHVDKDIAPIIQEIFEMHADGMGLNEIATILNRKGYPTPSQLKSQYENTNQTYIWNKQHISRILKHVIYTGDMPYGMREKISYKSKKYITKDKKDWIIIENHHEGIVTKKLFNQSQTKMKCNSQTLPRASSDKTFSGLLFCGRCGSRLVRKKRKNKPCAYICGKSDREGSIKNEIKVHYGCDTHRVIETDVVEIIVNYINILFNDKKLNKNVLYTFNNSRVNSLDIKRKINFCKNKIKILKLKASLIYEDKLNNSIPDFLFKEKISTISNELAEVELELLNYKKSSELLYGDSSSNSSVAKITEEICKSSINYTNVSMLFNKIVFFNVMDIKEENKKEYNMSNEDYMYIKENGGIVFVQNFIYNYTMDC